MEKMKRQNAINSQLKIPWIESRISWDSDSSSKFIKKSLNHYSITTTFNLDTALSVFKLWLPL